MNSLFIIFIMVFLGCFLTAYAWFAAINRSVTAHGRFTLLMQDTFLPILITAYAGFAALYFLLPNQYDQLFNLSFANISVIFFGTAVVYSASSLPKIAKYNGILFLAAAAAGAFFIPADFLLFENFLPFWADRISLVLIWTGFAWCYKYLDGIDGLVAVQTAAPLSGLIILAFIGALPVLTGGFAGALLAITIAYTVYNWYPAELKLSPAGCQALGFLVGWLLVLTALEGAAACALILSFYYFVEIIWAVILKFSRKRQYRILKANTFYYQTNVTGLSPSLICENIFKLDALLVIFAGFQIYAPNNYSLPVLSLILTLWFLTHLRNWQQQEQSFAELNRNLVKDIKDNVKDFRKTINKDNRPE